MPKTRFSRRNVPPPDTLVYTISQTVRARIIHVLYHVGEQTGLINMDRMVVDAAKRTLREYGVLKEVQDFVGSNKPYSQKALEHFHYCIDEQAIEFLEWCFESRSYCAENIGVEEINNVFRDEGIGYEFTPYIIHRIEHQGGGYSEDFEYPEAIRKSDELIHSTTIVPTICILGSKAFATAKAEMLKAHKHFREGEFGAAVNSAGESMESVLKTICDKKGWAYTKDKDPLGRLLGIVQQNGLITDIHKTGMQNTSADIRNKFGAHGKGQNPTYGFASAEIAEHMIQITSSHILLLVRLSKL